jgi:hypothetical protein
MKPIFKEPGSFCENHCWCPAGPVCRRGLSTLMAPDGRLMGPKWQYGSDGKCPHFVGIDAAWAKKNRYPLAKLEQAFQAWGKEHGYSS